MKYIIFFGLLACIYVPVSAQELKPIKGRVINQYNYQPIASATVEVMPSNLKTLTNDKGEFLIETSTFLENIIVSSIGYKTVNYKIKNDEKNFIIRMEPDNSELEEVIINTGYQEIPKERATGSFEVVSNKSLNNVIGPDILDRLEGNSTLLFDKGPGRPNITLRGIGTIEGNTNPLIVLDDFPYEGDINTINPEIVESISILKDAAAASIWGARASNGVIVITSKKGKYQQTPNINFRSSFQQMDKPDLFYYNQISSKDLIELEQFLFGEGYFNARETNINQLFLSPVVELLIANREGNINDIDLQNQLNHLSRIDSRDQYSEYMYRKAQNQQYAMDISGGVKNLSYYIMGGYDKSISNLSANNRRYSFQVNTDFKLSDKVSLSTQFSFIEALSENGYTGYSPSSLSRPYINLLNEQEEEIPHYKIRQPYAETVGNGLLMDWAEYPLSDALNDIQKNKSQNLIASLGLNYKLLEGLEFSSRFRIEQVRKDDENIRGIKSYFTRDLINRYASIDPVSNLIRYGIPNGDIFNLGIKRGQTHNGRIQLSYNRDWIKHRVDALLGGELRSANSKVNQNREYGYNRDRLLIEKVDYVNPFKDFITGFNVFIPFGNSIQESQTNFVSQYFNAAYTYTEKYTFSLSARRDGSNQFGLTTNDKWNPLWSSGISWNLSKERFYSFGLIPFMKFRATYGVTGNMDPSRTAVPIIYYQSVDVNSKKIKAVISQSGNPELRWERNKMLNLAVDFESIRGVVSGSFEYYNKKGIDLFGPAFNDITTGIGATVTKNVANMKGRGVDVRLNLKLIDSRIRWNTQIFYSYTKSEVAKYYNKEGGLKSSSYVSDGTRITPLVGYPLYSILSYPWAGLSDEGNSLGILNGEVSSDYLAIMNSDITNLVNSGSAVPEQFGSIMNLFHYKNISMNFNIQYKIGYFFRRPGLYYSSLFSVNNLLIGSSDYAQRWQFPGDEEKTNVPKLIYPANTYSDGIYQSSSNLVESAAHIRLKNININYSLHNFRRMRADVFLNFSNLGILWRANKKGIDPDYQYSLPSPQTYALGLKVSY